jgi:hypothetical protein
LKIWVNAFIPRDVDNYTLEMSQGQFTGQTAIPLPPIARLNPLNFFKPLSAGYLTDQRTFDSDLSAPVRMQSLAELSRGLIGWTLDNGFGVHRTSGTTEVDTEIGEFLDFGSAPMNRCFFSGGDIPVPDPGAPFIQIFHLRAAASDPLVSAAADIDYQGSFLITTTPGVEGDLVQIDWTLSLDAFPAFEAYVERDGAVVTLLTAPPPDGNTVQDLLGPPNRSFQGSVTLFPNIIVGPDE